MTPLLLVHVSGGTVALLAGGLALLARKGGRLHRAAGNIFFVAMLAMAGAGATLAAFDRPAMASVAAGSLTLYLVATAWVTVMRPERQTGLFEVAAGIGGATVAGFAFVCAAIAAGSPKGLHGMTAEIYAVFGTVAALAAAADASVILRGGLAGAQRIARHLWRMSAAMLIATASFFLGQPRFVPDMLEETGLNAVPVFAVIALMLSWLVRVLLTRWAEPAAAQKPA